MSAALGSADGIAEPLVPYNEPCTSGDMPCVLVAFLRTARSESGGLSVDNDSDGNDDRSSDVPARVSYGLGQ